jgi:CheY-like chemotaxis protein/anti-sigma regulatory factor (Ser/Thr protein kinase)
MNYEKEGDTLQKTLQDKSRQLDELLRTQHLMITNISHEIRTSLNAISGYLSLIDKKDALSNEDKGYLDKANHATSTLKTLVSDILNVSKINTGQMEIKEESFWLDEMILKCIDSIILGVNKKTITFKVEADILPYKLVGDHHHIMGIVVNLLSNAIKYTDSGFVHLIVKKDQENDGMSKILFQIEDSGIGISPEQIEQIFDPYTRFKTEKEGVGLGLHIASKLADKLDGNLSVESKLSEGSTFNFTVKLKRDSESSISMDNKVLCFFNNTKETKVFEQKTDFLKQFGAKLIQFSDEQEFTDYLLNLKDEIPDIISVTTYHETYTKYDALIHYLKNISRFQKTHFIAEGTETRIPLSYFDEIYECFTPISSYIHALKLLDKQQNEVDTLIENKIHILAVDDIETNLEILKLFIENKYPHATLDLAMGGYEAVGMYKTQTYDIILMDLKMPGLNGFEVLEKFKAIKNPPLIYALTADVYKDTYDRVMYSGFAGLLEKPLQLDLMFEAIEKAVNEKYN